MRLLILLLAGVAALSPLRALAAQSPHPPYADRMAEYVRTQMDAYRIPGMAIAIVRDGEVEYLEGFGTAGPDDRPVTPDTPFLLNSLSKSLTAVGVMQLADAGKLRLDDPVSKHLPWFEVADGAGDRITIAHLLYHTSGFSQFDGVKALYLPDAPDALEAGVRGLATVELAAEPGARYEYSNLNYNVLGLLIQAVSGQTYEAYMQDHVFAPLGMDRTFTSMDAARAAGAASGYYPFFRFPIVYDDFLAYSRPTLPSAGVWSSAADFSRYLMAQLDGGRYGGASLLSEETAALLHVPGVEIEPGLGYAMGWLQAPGFLDRDFLMTLDTGLRNYAPEDLEVLFHEGDGPSFKSVALMLPALDYGIVLLMNTNDYSITSALKNFAWDVTLIANGGEPYYFGPGEEFLVRHARLLFGGVIVLLAISAVRTARRLWRLRTGAPGGRPTIRQLIFAAGLPLLLDLALLGYVFLVFLPDNNATPAMLLRDTPDYALLLALLVLLAGGWALIRTTLYAIAWAREAS
jgi:CubicO group peptidase (beta-lactamase class C family)